VGSFRQLGDPVCPPPPACLCQHHGHQYAELTPSGTPLFPGVFSDTIANGVTIVSRAITITERCCITVNAASIVQDTIIETALEIERPVGTIRTTQEDIVMVGELHLLHHAVWEVLDPGTYTYYLVNRVGGPINSVGAWIKIIASDCEG
jgi:hypothetical protein